MSTVSPARRARLLQMIVPIVRCIVCTHAPLRHEPAGDLLCCPACGQTYPIHNDIPLMTLTPEQAIAFPPAAMVEHTYTPQWRAIVERAGAGLVLDFGAGNTPDTFANLIKFEIFAFPNVDVVGWGERTPFIDGAFQSVFSGAVFEHVTHPFACADEIFRILAPGGEVYIETAFLQPYHAYPHHYFNMTIQGLRTICGAFRELEVGVRPHQRPSFTLAWILDVWADKLRGDEREAFLGTSIGEILAEYKANPHSQRWMEGFTAEDDAQLACGVYFRGVKEQQYVPPPAPLAPAVRTLERMIAEKDAHIEQLEALLARIERGRVLRLLNWLRRRLT